MLPVPRGMNGSRAAERSKQVFADTGELNKKRGVALFIKSLLSITYLRPGGGALIKEAGRGIQHRDFCFV